MGEMIAWVVAIVVAFVAVVGLYMLYDRIARGRDDG